MKMPWGKYKGKELSEIPMQDLKQLFHYLRSRDTLLYGAILDEINRRKQQQ